jgi:hypothetical protein
MDTDHAAIAAMAKSFIRCIRASNGMQLYTEIRPINTSEDERAVDALVWYRPQRLERQFELRRDGRAIATMIFEPAPAFAWEHTTRHAATVETDAAKWRLRVRRHGLLGLKADVHLQGSSEGLLRAGFFLTTGTLAIGQTPTYGWRGRLWRRGVDVATHVEGFPVMRFEPGSYFDRIATRISVVAEITPAHDLVLLASAGLYLRLLMNKPYG